MSLPDVVDISDKFAAAAVGLGSTGAAPSFEISMYLACWLFEDDCWVEKAGGSIWNLLNPIAWSNFASASDFFFGRPKVLAVREEKAFLMVSAVLRATSTGVFVGLAGLLFQTKK